MKCLVRLRYSVLCVAALFPISGLAQADDHAASSVLHAHIDLPPLPLKDHVPAAVLWLKPLSGPTIVRSLPTAHYELVQKNRMFMPHLLVIPVGSIVSFPNEDPFFHNVFSLFNGKRFDLGLYEAGTSKDVAFSREGVSYIFCNIHPQMGAIVLALSTPYYATADRSGVFRIDDVPNGEYELHVWVDGLAQSSLDRLTHRVRLGPGMPDSLNLDARAIPREPDNHLNKFGQQYSRNPSPSY